MMKRSRKSVYIIFFTLAVEIACLQTPCHSFLHVHGPSSSAKRRRAFHMNSERHVEDASLTSAISSADFLICGGGPTGLLTAIMLHQKFPEASIQVHDRQKVPASTKDEAMWSDTGRYYLIGLGGRGITSLEAYGVDISPFSIEVPGRKDWTPESPEGIETIRSERKYLTQVLPRDKLVSILHEHILHEIKASASGGKISLVFESQVRPVDFEYQGKSGENVLVEVSSLINTQNATQLVAAKVVVAADGSARTFANAMEELDRQKNEQDPFRIIRFEDDNVRVYKTLPFRLPERGWNINTPGGEELSWNYAVRSENSRVIFDTLPANEKGDYVGVLLMRGDDPMAQSNVEASEFQDFLRQEVPQFFVLLSNDVIAAAASKQSSPLPQFRYVTPRMNQGKGTILLGDTAHTVKPYFGMGCNSALEDVKLFGECIDASNLNITTAMCNFSAKRTPDIETLIQTSRDLDRPGILGVFYFLIPVILDGIFSKLLPQWFLPNIISLIQNEEYSFQDAVKRKQQDRIGQLLLIAGFLSTLSWISSITFGVVASTS